MRNNIESRIERAERLVGEKHRDFDSDEPKVVRIVYDRNFYGTANRLPPNLQACWPDEELVEVR